MPRCWRLQTLRNHLSRKLTSFSSLRSLFAVKKRRWEATSCLVRKQHEQSNRKELLSENHQALNYTFKKKFVSTRITRWQDLQERYIFEQKYKQMAINCTTNDSSRFENQGKHLEDFENYSELAILTETKMENIKPFLI